MVEENFDVIAADEVEEPLEVPAAEAEVVTASIERGEGVLEIPAISSPIKHDLSEAAESPAGAEDGVEIDQLDVEVELSPVFRELAEVKLPELKRENRARLQMQSPTRLYFYWSVRENPWAMLKNIFGDGLGNYSLVLKLIDVTAGTEEVHRCEAEGNWWFDVEPNREYQAEVGFYSASRPYFRILNSNRVMTPRRTPSPRAATEASWMVSAGQFAKVLDHAGFTRDAFDVVMAGDDMGLAESSSQKAFADFIGDNSFALGGIAADEIRFALLALAGGTVLGDLRSRVSPTLFGVLEQNADKVDAERAQSALADHFDLEDEIVEEYETGPAVYGASLVSFPRQLRTRSASPKEPGAQRFSPLSSFSLR
jgi:hypothetical protein